ncbi:MULTISPECIES: hypothetical protein [Pseudomonas]|uniref:Uncharacterized protein n=1 Tax=Serpens gallinarum TaxID=2763075 RepID=A0ABR8TN20_9PSED|nr:MULTISPECIES: hypothetical protein [Pseudomonas]MBD7977162.1 hypothetical protein [Serpens gallinarum]MBF0674095.1 hypothetical protein [Pseudomonas sp.]
MDAHTKIFDFGGIVFDVHSKKHPNGWEMRLEIGDPINISRCDADSLYSTLDEGLAAGEDLGKKLINGYINSL